VCRLKIGDVDSERMALRVEQGKGAKERYAMLSPVVLQRLRAWRRVGRAQGKMLPGAWLFPGMNPMEPLTARRLNRAVRDAAAPAGIAKRVTIRSAVRSRPTYPEGTSSVQLGSAVDARSSVCRPFGCLAFSWTHLCQQWPSGQVDRGQGQRGERARGVLGKAPDSGPC
jgi:integrase